MDRNVQNGTLVRVRPNTPQYEKGVFNVIEIVCIAAGVIIGSFCGVTVMCLLQINQDKDYIFRKDNE